MLVEFSVITLGGKNPLSGDIAEVLKIVDASGLAYQLTPSGTCVEGQWDEVMGLLRKCSDRLRKDAPRVVWTIKIDDEEGVSDKLTRNLISVEEKFGRPLGRSRA